MTKYKSQKEVFLFGTNEKIQVPEIKVRYNKGKINDKITCVDDAYNFLYRLYGRSISVQEQVIVLFLDHSNNILGYYRHTVGTPVSSLADVPMILGIALKSLSRAIILSHNHPSGNNFPSDQDKRFTKKVSQAAKLLDLFLHDHIIVTKDNGYYSFAENNSILTGIEQTQPSVEERLRQEVFWQLGLVTKSNAPKIFRMLQTESGYSILEQRIIQMVARDKLTPSACIPQIESEL
jgi:DNA repair protein RadC